MAVPSPKHAVIIYLTHPFRVDVEVLAQLLGLGVAIRYLLVQIILLVKHTHASKQGLPEVLED